MRRNETDSPRLHTELGRRLAISAIAVASLWVAPLQTVDRLAWLVAFTLATVLVLRTLRRGGPRGASDYLVGVCMGAAVSGMAVALAILHLADDRGWVAGVYGCGAIALAGATVLGTRLALLVKRLPRLLDPGEQARAFAIGTTELDGRRKRVAVMMTDRRLMIAAPQGARPRLVSQLSLAGLDDIDVLHADGVADIALRANGASVIVRRVPVGQALNLVLALGPNTD